MQMFETGSTVIFKKEEIVYLRIREGSSLEIEETREVIQYLLSFYNGEPLKVFTDASEFFSISEESKKAFSSSDLNERIFRNAVYTNSLSIKLIGNLFIRVFKPGFPVRIFIEESEALKWLEEKNYSFTSGGAKSL